MIRRWCSSPTQWCSFTPLAARPWVAVRPVSPRSAATPRGRRVDRDGPRHRHRRHRAGPHAGDEEVRRFGVEIAAVARLHGTTVAHRRHGDGGAGVAPVVVAEGACRARRVGVGVGLRRLAPGRHRIRAVLQRRAGAARRHPCAGARNGAVGNRPSASWFCGLCLPGGLAPAPRSPRTTTSTVPATPCEM